MHRLVSHPVSPRDTKASKVPSSLPNDMFKYSYSSFRLFCAFLVPMLALYNEETYSSAVKSSDAPIRVKHEARQSSLPQEYHGTSPSIISHLHFIDL